MRLSSMILQRRIAVSLLTVLLLSVVGPTVAEAANRFWRGQMNNSNQFENPMNWSTTMGGSGGAAAPTAADNVYFMNNFSGSSLIGKNVWIKSHAIMKGLVINQNMTGTILLGTGSLNVGSDGIRMGSGRLIGSGHILGTTSNISGSGSFTMTGGVVRMGATNLYLSGSLAISKGTTSSYTEVVSTGALVFNSRIADQNLTLGSTIVGSLKSLTINNSASGTSDDIIVSASYLALSGALTITQGNLDLETNDVTLLVESGITLANSAQATLTMGSGNLTASGHIVTGAAGSWNLTASNTVTLNGVNQNFDTNNHPIYNLTIAPSGTVTLTSDQSVTHTLQINTGSTVSLGSYTIYATGATIINYGTITEGTGKIEHDASTVKITDSSYAEDNSFDSGDRMFFTVTDSDENIDGTAQDTISVTVSAGSDTETVTLTETTNTSGVFRGSIDTNASTSTANVAIVAGDSIIESNEDTTVTLTYTDAQDGGSATDTTSLTADVPTTTTSSSTTGGGRGGAARASGAAKATTPSVTTPTSTVKSAAPTAPTLKGRAEARKAERLARASQMLKRSAARAAARRGR